MDSTTFRGFLFGSLRDEVAPLDEFLGESRKIIDMVVDQSPEGIEVLRGSSSYVSGGNWKLTAENGADGYHVTAVHWNYAATQQQQRKLRDAEGEIRTMSAVAGARRAAVLLARRLLYLPARQSQWSNNTRPLSVIAIQT